MDGAKMSNEKIYVIGHKNPDTDSICSAIGYADFKGEGFVPSRAGEISLETQFVLDYFHVSAPEFLADATNQQIILVDHNEVGQAVDGLEHAFIKEIIDHHKIGDVQTSEPILFRNLPVGCTATIVYLFFQESGKKPGPQIAGVLCSAILSDTLAFRSPTCTATDKEAAEYLAEIAGISDLEAYAKEMFIAGSDLDKKSDQEIFYQDYKNFSAGNTTFGVGQITAMSADSFVDLKPRMLKYMQENYSSLGVDMLFLMLTDILSEATELIYYGEGAETAVKAAFISAEANKTYLPGVMSRKKQVVPQLTEALK